MSRRTNVLHDSDALDEALGAAIRVRRHAKGLSQAQLGAAAGVSFQQLQKYERGTNRVSFSMLVHICRALGCTVADIAADVDQLAPEPGTPMLPPESGLLLDALARIESTGMRRAVLALALDLARATESGRASER